MNRLAELLPFNAGESLASHSSRLAAACGYSEARSFATDHRFTFQGLANGNPDDLAVYSDLLDVSLKSLSPGGISRDGTVVELPGGNRLWYTQMEQSRIRFCPFCVREDEHEAGGRRGFRSFGRMAWQILPFRACPRHDVRLITGAPVENHKFYRDFAANLRREISLLDRKMADAEKALPDRLQRYIGARLTGQTTGSPWLDTMPVYMAIKACEVIGACERHGTGYNSKGFDDREWSSCTDAGYEILLGGESGLRAFLIEIFDRTLVEKRNTQGRAVFDFLDTKLAPRTFDEAYVPIRNVIREVALNLIPVGPGDDLLGPVTERRFHSIETASQELGINGTRLRRKLISAGLIRPGSMETTLRKTLIAPSVLQALGITKTEKAPATKKSLTGFSGDKAATYVGAEPYQFLVLVRYGFIARDPDQPSTDRRHRQHNLDAFMDRIKNVVTADDEPGLECFSECARLTGETLGNIVEVLLAGSLKTVALAADEIGLAAVRLRPREVSECLSPAAKSKG